MKKYFLYLLASVVCVSACSPERKKEYAPVRIKLNSILDTTKAVVGIAIIDLQNSDTLTVNNDIDFPMMSVFKFPLALAILDQVEKGKLSLSQRVDISDSLSAKFNSGALKRQLPGPHYSMTIDSLIMYTVGYSDNLSCDVLFELAGGADKVNEFVKGKGIDGIQIKYNEVQMFEDMSRIYDNSSSPLAMSRLLQDFDGGKIVGDSSRKYLMNYMIHDSTTSKRLRGLIPKGEVIIAHKTGTGATSDSTVQACNDVGIFFFPDGRKFAVSVFVRDSKIGYDSTEALIAKLSYEIYAALKENK